MNAPQLVPQGMSAAQPVIEDQIRTQLETAIKAGNAEINDLEKKMEVAKAAVNQNIGMLSLLGQLGTMGVKLVTPAQQGEADVLPFQQSTEQIMNGAANEASGS